MIVGVEGALGSSGGAMVLICLLFVCVWSLTGFGMRRPQRMEDVDLEGCCMNARDTAEKVLALSKVAFCGWGPKI